MNTQPIIHNLCFHGDGGKPPRAKHPRVRKRNIFTNEGPSLLSPSLQPI
jgi:hypothetical protein